MLKKPHYIIFAMKNFTTADLNVQIEGHTIDEAYQTQFLDVIIDNNLTWKQHIVYLTYVIAIMSAGVLVLHIWMDS